eukprot:TRINITY_DN631_c0_g1_i2.p3 TRINITY_DN631_c0_g1~~TRINITY_DN631_c0_g1_i2.p3  ORF type:complete len:206 (-),score=4.06 TRINITY_DN631_c0_g1_i2:661-1278(-)
MRENQVSIIQDCNSSTVLEPVQNVPVTDLTIFKNCVQQSKAELLKSHFAHNTIHKLSFPYLQNEKWAFRFVKQWMFSMRNLRYLEIKVVGFTFENVQKFGNLRRLTTLSLGYLKQYNIFNLDQFQKLQVLEITWDLQDNKYSRTPIQFQCKLPNLKQLIVQRGHWKPGFAGIDNLPSVERISLTHQSVNAKKQLCNILQNDIIIE